jgi:signal peptidase II
MQTGPFGPAAPREPRRPLLALAILLFTVGLVGCDHATKSVAESSLSGREAISVLPGLMDLRYAQNHDTAFSLLHGVEWAHKSTLLLILASAALAAVAVAWFRRRARATVAEHAAFAMIFAGAVGNVADRARRGFVVDFIHVEHWPVFNVADIAVVAGVLLLALATFRARSSRSRS